MINNLKNKIVFGVFFVLFCALIFGIAYVKIHQKPTPPAGVVQTVTAKNSEHIKKKVKKFRPDGSLESETDTDQDLESFIAAKLQKVEPAKPDNLIVITGWKFNLLKFDVPEFKSIDALYRPLDEIPIYGGFGYDKEHNETQIKAAYSSRIELFK